MRCKVKISYSDKGKIIAKLYSNGAMVTLEWGDTIEEIIDKVSANRKKLMKIQRRKTRARAIRNLGIYIRYLYIGIY